MYGFLVIPRSRGATSRVDSKRDDDSSSRDDNIVFYPCNDIISDTAMWLGLTTRSVNSLTHSLSRKIVGDSVSFPTVDSLSRRGIGKEKPDERKTGETERGKRFHSPLSRSLPAPLQNSSVAVRAPAEGAATTLGATAARARHTFRSSDGFFRRVQQQFVQHLANGAVLAVERVRVHV